GGRFGEVAEPRRRGLPRGPGSGGESDVAVDVLDLDHGPVDGAGVDAVLAGGGGVAHGGARPFRGGRPGPPGRGRYDAIPCAAPVLRRGPASALRRGGAIRGGGAVRPGRRPPRPGRGTSPVRLR